MIESARPAPIAADSVRSLAHHARDGSFRNPWPDSQLHDRRALLRFATERRTQKLAPTPPRGSFPVAQPAIVYPRAPETDLSATWIGHSTILLQLCGLNVLTDPMFSQRSSPVQWAGPRRVMPPALPIEALPPLDVVLQSHNHYDHLDRKSVKRIARAHPDAVWVVPLKLAASIKRWGVREVIEVDWWQEAEINKLKVTATPSRHFSARGLHDRNRTLWCGFALELAGKRVYFAGDTAYHPDFGEIGARVGPFDLVMIPIGAYDPRWFMRIVHVNPEEGVQIYQDLVAAQRGKPLPLMLAIHWGTFRLTYEPMEEPPRRAAARWREVGLDPERLWIARFGETRRIDLPRE